MNIQALRDVPPWEWPAKTAALIKQQLRDKNAPAADRLLAVEMAGQNVVVDDEIAELLVAIVDSRDPDDHLRARAAISLGPILEDAEMEGVDDEDDPVGEPSIQKSTFTSVQNGLRRAFEDESNGKEARRRALEGSVRAPQDWHADAVRKVSAIDDPEWKLTATFAMGYVSGFDAQIVQAIGSADPMVRFEAVRAAGTQEVAEAWPQIEAILQKERKDKDLLLAAIEAAPLVNPDKAGPILVELSDSDDEEIAEAAADAMTTAEGMDGDEEEEDV